MNKPNPFSYITLVTVVLFIGGCATVAYAQKAKTSETREWLQFRGPNGTGVAEGVTLPAEFGPNKNSSGKQHCRLRDRRLLSR